MEQKLKEIKKKALIEIEKVKSKEDLEHFHIKYLGRKGLFARTVKKIGDLPLARKAKAGKLANEVKNILQSVWQAKKQELLDFSKIFFVDITAPGKRWSEGHLHLVTEAIREVERIFLSLGFIRRRYPEVETDYYTFESLNMPEGHPARDEWETFFISDKSEVISKKSGKLVLTPHTSSGQVREMESHSLPIRMMNISKCYRRQIDVNHTPMFHQFEGLVVDRGIQFIHLKGVLEYFCREFYGPKRRIRLRPFHFRFTEPSFEVDVTCGLCGGRGCRYCKQGWAELGGAGMVHPNVLRAGGQDPKKVTGFAFGWGVERCYLMKEGLLIPDLRMLYQNDLRFLEQF